MSMRSHYLLGLGPGGFHRIAYTDWGATAEPRVLVAVHGLTRSGRDFDRLAAVLSAPSSAVSFRVVCPDMPGRGRSDWLHADDYGYPQYLAGMAALIARLGVREVDWIGTSMGGLIGMMLAAQPNTPVRRLVMNDIGPFVPKAGLGRLADYVGKDPHFATLDELEAYLRRVHAPFGPLGDQDWRHLALQGYRRRDGGGFGLAYDPAIGRPFQNGKIEDVDLWPVWDAVRCPVLLLRGAQSDILPADTAREMAARGPKAKTAEFAGVGHAPALTAEDQILLVRDWLLTAA